MGFRATNFTVSVLLLMAATIFMMFVRMRKPVENNWPFLYWVGVAVARSRIWIWPSIFASFWWV